MKKDLKIRNIFTFILIVIGIFLVSLYVYDDKPILDLLKPGIMYFLGVLLIRIPCYLSDENNYHSTYRHNSYDDHPTFNKAIILRVIGYLILGISFIIMFVYNVNL